MLCEDVGVDVGEGVGMRVCVYVHGGYSVCVIGVGRCFDKGGLH